MISPLSRRRTRRGCVSMLASPVFPTSREFTLDLGASGALADPGEWRTSAQNGMVRRHDSNGQQTPGRGSRKIDFIARTYPIDGLFLDFVRWPSPRATTGRNCRT